MCPVPQEGEVQVDDPAPVAELVHHENVDLDNYG